jgi:type IV pilus biogenesis protein CpaD/CtpE
MKYWKTAVVAAVAASLAGCAGQQQGATTSAPASDAEARIAVNENTPSDDIFAFHDKNGDGTLDRSEFATAHRFNPTFDCNAADSIDDPRCDRWRATHGGRR